MSSAALGPSCLYESSPDPVRVPCVPQATWTARAQPLPSPRSPSCSVVQIRDTSVPVSLPTVPSPAQKVALPPSGGLGLRPQTRSPLCSLFLHIQSISKPRALAQNPTQPVLCHHLVPLHARLPALGFPAAAGGILLEQQPVHAPTLLRAVLWLPPPSEKSKVLPTPQVSGDWPLHTLPPLPSRPLPSSHPDLPFLNTPSCPSPPTPHFCPGPSAWSAALDLSVTCILSLLRAVLLRPACKTTPCRHPSIILCPDPDLFPAEHLSSSLSFIGSFVRCLVHTQIPF